MRPFATFWPWIGLGLAALLLPALWTGVLRTNRASPRFHDMSWLAWAATTAYLLHQFEEHGIDAHGVPYAFRGFLCAMLGLGAPSTCPIPAAFITAVNVPVVWLAGPASALLGRRRPEIALSYFSVPAVNAFAHIGPAVANGGYDPGLLTALLLFVPLCAWAFHVALANPQLGRRAVTATLFAGIVLHLVLMLSLKAWLGGLIGERMMIFIQIINPVLPMLLVPMALRSGRGSLR